MNCIISLHRKKEKSILTALSKKEVKAAVNVPYHFISESGDEGDKTV